MKAVAVDFDGVIHAYSKGWQDGSIYDEPVEGAFDALRTLMKDYAVFVHTTRDASDVAAWLRDRGGFETTDLSPRDFFWKTQGVLLVTDRKYPAIVYIDDRALRFESWAQTMMEMVVRR